MADLYGMDTLLYDVIQSMNARSVGGPATGAVQLATPISCMRLGHRSRPQLFRVHKSGAAAPPAAMVLREVPDVLHTVPRNHAGCCTS